jgi:hypothetical protein
MVRIDIGWSRIVGIPPNQQAAVLVNVRKDTKCVGIQHEDPSTTFSTASEYGIRLSMSAGKAQGFELLIARFGCARFLKGCGCDVTSALG